MTGLATVVRPVAAAYQGYQYIDLSSLATLAYLSHPIVRTFCCVLVRICAGDGVRAGEMRGVQVTMSASTSAEETKFETSLTSCAQERTKHAQRPLGVVRLCCWHGSIHFQSQVPKCTTADRRTCSSSGSKVLNSASPLYPERRR